MTALSSLEVVDSRSWLKTCLGSTKLAPVHRQKADQYQPPYTEESHILTSGAQDCLIKQQCQKEH